MAPSTHAQGGGGGEVLPPAEAPAGKVLQVCPPKTQGLARTIREGHGDICKGPEMPSAALLGA